MTLKTTFLFFIALLGQIQLSAQRTYDIPFRATVPTIDGTVEEDSLQGLPVFDQFTTTLPVAGKTPQSPTKAWMIHTPEGIYVAAICSSNNLRNEGSVRDQTGTGDYLTLGFDTWNDDQNAFEFTVNAFGQRIEQRTTSTFSEIHFNTHWQVRTDRRADGWTAEFFIPFTALRFSKSNDKGWGVQMTRFDPSTGETSNWNPTDPLVRDRVLQYGTLENLAIGKTKQRLGVAVYAGTGLFDQFLTHRSAVDGKVGIGTASTLDVSILPEQLLFDADIDDFSFTLYGTSPPHPRQFRTEEPGLFVKTGNFNLSSDINNSIFLPYFKTPATFLSKTTRALNQVRFSSRCNNGIGYVVSNTLLSRPVADLGTRYPHQPFVNSISVEKSLRNNSWVQVSNRFYGFGEKEINQNYTTVATQLRDKTNRFEINSQLNTKMQNNHTIADGRIGIQKVNGIFQYGLNHTTLKKIEPNFIGSIFPELSASTTGHFHWNNFSGKQKYWLNSTRYLRFNANHFDFFKNRTVYYCTIGHRGLNKRFQEIDMSLGIHPLGQREVLVFPDTKFESKQLYWPLTAHFSFTTDARRRAIVQLAARLRNTALNLSQAEIKVAGRWVAHQKLVLSLEQDLIYNHNRQLINTTTLQPERLLEQHNAIYSLTNAHIQYTPSRIFTYHLGVQNQWISWRKRQMFEFANGSLFNYPYEFDYNPAQISRVILHAMADINFNSAGLLRFRYFYNIDINYNKNFYNSQSLNLTLIWNINRI
jgi:hypothetical protein